MNTLHARRGRSYPSTRGLAQSLGLTAGESGRMSAVDYFVNAAARTGWGTNSLVEATDYDLVRLSYNYLLLITLYRNHWITRAIVDIPAQDMTRAWPRLTSDMPPEDATKIDKAIRRTQTKARVLEALCYARLFGGGGALIVVDGQEHQLDEPLDPHDIELGSFQGIIPFDRWSGIVPDGNVCTDVRRPVAFNLPEYYTVTSPDGSGGMGGTGFRVHASRILRFAGPAVPSPEYQAQQWWGISVVEPAFEEVRKRDNMSWNILMATFRMNLISIQDPELAQSLSGLNMTGKALQAYQSRMQALNDLMSNQSLLITGKDGGMSSTQYAFSGTADVYQQFQMDIAGAARIPVTRLFGRTISGLGQANDQDERIYEEVIALQQDTALRPQLEKLYPIIAMSELGEVPDDMNLIFPSVRVLTEEEKADLGKTISDNVLGLFNAGLYSKAMALRELQNASESTGMFTNITDEDIAEAEKEQDMAGEMGGPPMTEMPGQEQQEGAAPGQPKQTGPQLVPPKKPLMGPLGPLDVPANKGLVQESGKRAGHVKSPTTQASGEHQARELVRQFEPKPKGEERGEHRTRPRQTAADGASASPMAMDDREFAGFPITVEYPKGVRRRITNDRGETVYDKKMLFDYGFIRNTVGRDGDEIDVICGPDPDSQRVFVIGMRDLGPDKDKREDEDKVFLGFNDPAEARDAFLTMYPEPFVDGIKEYSAADYMELLDDQDGAITSTAEDMLSHCVEA